MNKSFTIGPGPCWGTGGKRKGCKTWADYSRETLTPANHALCDWGHANIAEIAVTNMIGQKLVDLFKGRAVHLEPSPAVYLMAGHISNRRRTQSALCTL